jgi:hypothetical protein
LAHKWHNETGRLNSRELLASEDTEQGLLLWSSLSLPNGKEAFRTKELRQGYFQWFLQARLGGGPNTGRNVKRNGREPSAQLAEILNTLRLRDTAPLLCLFELLLHSLIMRRALETSCTPSLTM